MTLGLNFVQLIIILKFMKLYQRLFYILNTCHHPFFIMKFLTSNQLKIYSEKVN